MAAKSNDSICRLLALHGSDCYTLSEMIRPFNLRDLALVRRLSEHSISLHTESALTSNLHPLRGALFSLVGGEFPTFVWKLAKGSAAGFIQLSVEEDDHHARIICLGSEPEARASASNDDKLMIDENVWLPLLEQAVVEVGRRGIHSLVAEVDETGPELPVLRRAGFAVYTRQDVWQSDETAIQQKPEAIELRPRRPIDDWDIQLLYGNMVPRLVQLVEPVPPMHQGVGWLLHENSELAAFVHIRAGSVATWMRLFIHPNAEAQADDIIGAAIQVVARKSPQTIYCCVRRYQSWLRGPMERAGFELRGSQAVMVKHTVQHMQKPLSEMSAVLDRQRIPASAPMVPRYDRPRVNGKATYR